MLYPGFYQDKREKVSMMKVSGRPGDLRMCSQNTPRVSVCLWKARVVSPGDSGLKEESRAGSKDPPKPDYTCSLEKE